MKAIRKMGALALALVLSVGLVACSTPSGGAASGSTVSAAGTQEAGGNSGYTAHVFFWNYADPFVGSIRTNLEAELKAAGIEAKFYDGGNDQSKQNEQIDTAISSGADILVLNLVQSETGETVLKKAEDAGIPAIFFNRQPPASIFDGKENAVLIDGDMIGGAKVQGQLIADTLLEDYDRYAGEDGVVDYVMVRAELSHEAANFRTEYAVSQANAVLTTAGKPELRRYAGAPEDLLADDWSAGKGKDAMSTLLSTVKNPGDINLIICNNDGIAEGVVSALNDVDYNKGDAAKFIPVFGYDATDSGKDLIAQGKLAGTVLQDATMNARAITTMVKNNEEGKEFIEGSEFNYDGTFKRIVISDVAYDPAA